MWWAYSPPTPFNYNLATHNPVTAKCSLQAPRQFPGGAKCSPQVPIALEFPKYKRVPNVFHKPLLTP